MASKLTVKQEKYAQGLFAGLTQRAAYKQAYNCENMKDTTIDRNAHEMANNSKLVARLAELTATLQERNMLTVEKVLEEYAKLSFSEITDFLEVETVRVLVGKDHETGEPISDIRQLVLLKDTSTIPKDKLAAISEVRQNKDGSISFKLHDKRGALDSIAKYLGMFVEKHEVTGKDGEPITIETAEERKKRIEELLKKRDG